MNKPDLSKLLTIYGRKPVLEALQDQSLVLYKLHLTKTNKPGAVIDDIIHAAEKRNIEIKMHDKLSLSRISKNSQQDQGVALDIHMPGFINDQNFLIQKKDKPFQLIALDGITNPQNLGMIIRSVCASKLDGLLLPERGCAKLDSLVIKASAGTLFRCNIIRCDNLVASLQRFSNVSTALYLLDSRGDQSLFDCQINPSSIFVLGNETQGIGKEILEMNCTKISIPMQNGVESLNVAVTAALVAFHVDLAKQPVN